MNPAATTLELKARRIDSTTDATMLKLPLNVLPTDEPRNQDPFRQRPAINERILTLHRDEFATTLSTAAGRGGHAGHRFLQTVHEVALAGLAAEGSCFFIIAE